MNLIPGDFVIKGSKLPETPENRQFARRHAIAVGLMAVYRLLPCDRIVRDTKMTHFKK